MLALALDLIRVCEVAGKLSGCDHQNGPITVPNVSLLMVIVLIPHYKKVGLYEARVLPPNTTREQFVVLDFHNTLAAFEDKVLEIEKKTVPIKTRC